ncbi:hypothetical protein PRBEI_2001055100 [Prionailurus iriomotensis]
MLKIVLGSALLHSLKYSHPEHITHFTTKPTLLQKGPPVIDLDKNDTADETGRSGEVICPLDDEVESCRARP